MRIHMFIKQLLEIPRHKLIIPRRRLDLGSVKRLFKGGDVFNDTNGTRSCDDPIHNSILKSVTRSSYSLLKLRFFHLFICSSSTKLFNLCSYFKQIRFCSEIHFHLTTHPCRSCRRCRCLQQIDTFWLNGVFNGIINTRSNRRGSGNATCEREHQLPIPFLRGNANQPLRAGTGDVSLGLSAARGTALLVISA